MTTNVSSGLTKYKLLLTETGQADNATGGLAKGAGWDMRGTDCGQARTWEELTWGKWDRLRHEGKWLGAKKNRALWPKPLYLAPQTKLQAPKIETWNNINQWSFCQYSECQGPRINAKPPYWKLSSDVSESAARI